MLWRSFVTVEISALTREGSNVRSYPRPFQARGTFCALYSGVTMEFPCDLSADYTEHVVTACEHSIRFKVAAHGRV